MWVTAFSMCGKYEHAIFMSGAAIRPPLSGMMTFAGIDMIPAMAVVMPVDVAQHRRTLCILFSFGVAWQVIDFTVKPLICAD
ncbi:hypothetical protein [Arenimonas sp. GDDSR-1]|uniref:hypothetical protein n=1 Tax=Arenimonas sp. GDDSR-1 TaxID=2950125 RepID=UPI00261B1240|nr:hypothetical protein [Arenimonas sp. GDDSR-1]